MVQDLVDEGCIKKPIDGNHGGIHPKGSDFVNAGIPFIMASDIVESQIDLTSCKFITEEQASRLQKGHSFPGDVLLTHKATLGRTAIVPDLTTRFIMLTPQVTYYRVTDESKVDRRFLKYFFDSPRFQTCLVNHGDAGSTRSYIGITAQRALPICLPSNHEQRAIGDLLSSLDDKIDLLHRQNATLEALAETLFRQYFIEEAQDDWEEVKLGNCFKITYGKNLPTTKLTAEGFPVFGGNGQIGWFTRYLYQERQVLVACRGAASGVVNFSSPRSFVTNNSLILERSKIEYLSYEYVKYFALNHDFKQYVTGSAQPQITIAEMTDSKIILPPHVLIETFTSDIKPIEQKTQSNKIQIQTLEKLRDTLLPKLMSGAVRVQFERPDAEAEAA